MVNNLFRNKIVVVTGAGSGLGKALVKELAVSKADVVLVGRKKEALLAVIKEIEQSKAKTGRLFAVPGDISTKEGCETLIKDIKRAAGTFEVLINNAASFTAGKFDETKPEDLKKLLDTNIFGTIYLTRLALPILTSNKKPGLINIAGFTGKVALPYLSLVSASKFAVSGFTEALQREIGEQLKIMGVYPAWIKTNHLKGMEAKMEKMNFFFENPEMVAKKILESYNLLKKELVLGKREKSLIFWNNLNKKSVDNKIKKIKSRILNASQEIR